MPVERKQPQPKSRPSERPMRPHPPPAGLALFDLRLRLVQIDDVTAETLGIAKNALGSTLKATASSAANAVVPLLERVVRSGAAALHQQITISGPNGAGKIRRCFVSCFPINETNRKRIALVLEPAEPPSH